MRSWTDVRALLLIEARREENRGETKKAKTGMFHKQPKVGNSSMSQRLEKQKRQKGQKLAKTVVSRKLGDAQL